MKYTFGWCFTRCFGPWFCARSESFEVYGFDFLIGEDLKPWLLGKLDLDPSIRRNIETSRGVKLWGFHWASWGGVRNSSWKMSEYWNPKNVGKPLRRLDRWESESKNSIDPRRRRVFLECKLWKLTLSSKLSQHALQVARSESESCVRVSNPMDVRDVGSYLETAWEGWTSPAPVYGLFNGLLHHKFLVMVICLSGVGPRISFTFPSTCQTCRDEYQGPKIGFRFFVVGFLQIHIQESNLSYLSRVSREKPLEPAWVLRFTQRSSCCPKVWLPDWWNCCCMVSWMLSYDASIGWVLKQLLVNKSKRLAMSGILNSILNGEGVSWHSHVNQVTRIQRFPPRPRNRTWIPNCQLFSHVMANLGIYVFTFQACEHRPVFRCSARCVESHPGVNFGFSAVMLIFGGIPCWELTTYPFPKHSSSRWFSCFPKVGYGRSVPFGG